MKVMKIYDTFIIGHVYICKSHVISHLTKYIVFL